MVFPRKIWEELHLMQKEILRPCENNHQETEAYLEPSRTSVMEFFMKIVNFTIFAMKAPPKIFDWVLNTPLKGVLQNSCYQESFTKSLKNTRKEKLLILFFH